MATINFNGQDTVQLNGRVLKDFSDGDIAVLTFPNELVGVKAGKNGNTIFALNETGRVATLDIKIMRASSDDIYLNALFLSMQRDFSRFTALNGQLLKNIGNGSGSVSADIYMLSYGVFRQAIDAKSNVEGDTEQGSSLYRLTFANAPRIIS